MDFLCRQDGVKDPHEKDGGSFQVVARERQAITDLETRIVTLRRGIQSVNDTTVVSINGITRTIAEWLTWRRDVAPTHQAFLNKLRSGLSSVRQQVRAQGNNVIAAGGQAEKSTDWVININEQELAKEIELLEDTLGQLDGQLSLKNATVPIAA
jgi:hypothetical protein